MPKVFISHSSLDRVFAEQELVPLLEGHGVETWYSRDDIRAATDWEASIREALKRCDWFLVVLSPNAAGSDWVRAEVDWAMENRKDHIVPLQIGKCDPSRIHLRLRTIQHVEYQAGLRESRERLLKVWGIDYQIGTSDVPSRRSVATAFRTRPWRWAGAGSLAVVAALMWGAWWRGGPAAPPAKPIPAWAASLPAAPVLRLVYQGTPSGYSSTRPTRLAISLLVRHDGSEEPENVADGATLSAADSYFLEIEPSSTGSIYVFQIDSEGKLAVLFPAQAGVFFSSGSNPVAAGKMLRVPAAEKGRGLRLDNTLGIEHVYIILNAEPWVELEAALLRHDVTRERTHGSRLDGPGATAVDARVAGSRRFGHHSGRLGTHRPRADRLSRNRLIDRSREVVSPWPAFGRMIWHTSAEAASSGPRRAAITDHGGQDRFDRSGPWISSSSTRTSRWARAG